MSIYDGSITKDQYMALKVYGIDTELTIWCSRCFRCCRNQHGGILITPHDLYRIAKYLGHSVSDIYTRYCQPDTGKHSFLPIVLAAAPMGTCIFLRNRKCILGDAMPGLCRFTPFARFVNLDGRIDFIDTGKTCGSKSRKMTIRQWVGEFGSDEYEEIARHWGSFSQRVSRLLTADTDPAVMESLPAIHQMILEACYYGIDTAQSFLPQLEAATEHVEETLFMRYSLVLPDIEEIQELAHKEGLFPTRPRTME